MKRKFTPLLLSFFLVGFGDAAWLDNREGDRLYNAGKFDEAAKAYQRAKSGNGDDKGIVYNLGNSQYRSGAFDEAIKSYTGALETDDFPLKEKAMFNLGAAYYKEGVSALDQGDMEEAQKSLGGSVAQYKSLLTERPGDNDVRHNLELALNKLEEMEKQKQERQKENKPGDEDQEGDQGDGQDQQSGDDKNKNEEEKKEKGEEPNEPQESKNDKDKKQEQSDEPKEGMTKKQAQQILDAIEKDEQALRKTLKAKEAGKTLPPEKDW